MDVQMPEMDGCEAAAAIREAEHARGVHTSSVTMTAHTMMGDRRRYLEVGMGGYVSKPSLAQTVFEVIDKVCAVARPA
jgi:CheY-like chemotaxis protein